MWWVTAIAVLALHEGCLHASSAIGDDPRLSHISSRSQRNVASAVEFQHTFHDLPPSTVERRVLTVNEEGRIIAEKRNAVLVGRRNGGVSRTSHRRTVKQISRRQQSRARSLDRSSAAPTFAQPASPSLLRHPLTIRRQLPLPHSPPRAHSIEVHQPIIFRQQSRKPLSQAIHVRNPKLFVIDQLPRRTSTKEIIHNRAGPRPLPPVEPPRQWNVQRTRVRLLRPTNKQLTDFRILPRPSIEGAVKIETAPASDLASEREIEKAVLKAIIESSTTTAPRRRHRPHRPLQRFSSSQPNATVAAVTPSARRESSSQTLFPAQTTEVPTAAPTKAARKLAFVSREDAEAAQANVNVSPSSTIIHPEATATPISPLFAFSSSRRRITSLQSHGHNPRNQNRDPPRQGTTVSPHTSTPPAPTASQTVTTTTASTTTSTTSPTSTVRSTGIRVSPSSVSPRLVAATQPRNRQENLITAATPEPVPIPSTTRIAIVDERTHPPVFNPSHAHVFEDRLNQIALPVDQVLANPRSNHTFDVVPPAGRALTSQLISQKPNQDTAPIAKVTSLEEGHEKQPVAELPPKTDVRKNLIDHSTSIEVTEPLRRLPIPEAVEGSAEPPPDDGFFTTKTATTKASLTTIKSLANTLKTNAGAQVTTADSTSSSSSPPPPTSRFTTPNMESTTHNSSAEATSTTSSLQSPASDFTNISDLREELIQNAIAEATQPTLTPPPSSSSSLRPPASMQEIGAPGAAPPNDLVVDELNRADNFMEVARRLRILRSNFAQRRQRRSIKISGDTFHVNALTDDDAVLA